MRAGRARFLAVLVDLANLGPYVCLRRGHFGSFCPNCPIRFGWIGGWGSLVGKGLAERQALGVGIFEGLTVTGLEAGARLTPPRPLQ